MTGLGVVTAAGVGADPASAPLPPGVRAVWDLDLAERQATPTRERICLNGLWQWQPASGQSDQPPTEQWGHFKVPGSWPGITDYMQKDSQTVYAHPAWQNQKLGSLTAAWYQRQFEVPESWAGRRVAVSLEYLHSYAALYVDGQKAGEIRFPAGEVDITAWCRPGARHQLSLLVVALPLKGVLLSYTDSASVREVKGTVARRGLCGDAFLVSTPSGARIADVKVSTSLRRQQIRFEVALAGLPEGAAHTCRARIIEKGHVVREFPDRAVEESDRQAGHLSFTESWLPDRLWDIHTPQHTYEFEVSLRAASGRLLDTSWIERFGFREFWIEGRDFYLNGTRLFLSAVPLDNAQVGAALAEYGAARESLERLQSFGINYVYTHNYGCEPGSHLSFAEILRAADDVGMLVGLSQPHFSHYDWQGPAADATNGYATHAAFYARVAQHHPAVVMYAMSHNATGYSDDMNPDMIDGVQHGRDTWAERNAKVALRAEAIVQRLDPSRIVYHHASGNLGSMHPINFYPNFVPIQEMSDWFEPWATRGVKPVFLCEYAAPFSWDWTLYRGWYRGQREFGSARVPWEFCLAEWNAQFLGDRAYAIDEAERANLRWEAKQYRAGNLWHRWDYPFQVGSTRFADRYPVYARYLTDNWRAFRTWGVSAISPWEHGHYWQLREGVDRGRQTFAVHWERLQRPGFSPDYLEQRYERMDLAYAREDWVPTPAAQALLRNNRPLLAYIAGKPARFTSQDHNFFPGETVEKQFLALNNSRERVRCEIGWTLRLHQALSGAAQVIVDPGQQARIPWSLELPSDLVSGRYELSAQFKFSTGEMQDDRFAIDVLPQPKDRPVNAKIAVFDPPGETAALLDRLGLQTESVGAEADLSGFDWLIVGKAALRLDEPGPNLRLVPHGLKVVLFEQTAKVLEQRLGFRVVEYGLRQVFVRVPDHAVLAGLTPEHLQDWRGEATLVSPRLDYELRPRHGPTVQWCGLPVTRLWRCGNQGNVASVLIEKPTRGDFLPLLDGGFSLQYSPLLEYREGRGLVVLCQVDVTGRTEVEPAAELLVRNLLRYVAEWRPTPRRTVVYAGEAAGRTHLETIGLEPRTWPAGPLGSAADEVLVVGPGGGRELAARGGAGMAWLAAGGHVVAIGLGQGDADALTPLKVQMQTAEHIAAVFEPGSSDAWWRGISPADVHNRDPRPVPRAVAGAESIGQGILAAAADGRVVFCQLAPWQFGGSTGANLRRTHRRVTFTVSRLLGNLGVGGAVPLLEYGRRPVTTAQPERRWLASYYLDTPEEWDDPYRFFRW